MAPYYCHSRLRRERLEPALSEVECVRVAKTSSISMTYGYPLPRWIIGSISGRFQPMLKWTMKTSLIVFILACVTLAIMIWYPSSISPPNERPVLPASYTIGLLANLIVLIIAGVKVAKKQMGRLIFINLVIGSLLLVIALYDFYAIDQRLPSILGPYGHLISFVAIMGLLTVSGLSTTGTFRLAAFSFMGLLTLVHLALWPFLVIYEFIFLLPFMAILLLTAKLILWSSIKL